MSAQVAAHADGKIFYSAGDINRPYGIASLSKIWAAVLIHDRIKTVAFARKISLDAVLAESVTAAIDYEPMIYSRMEPRSDLQPPDDPLTYQPFRKEKAKFRLPVEKGKSYTVRDLFEAALFQSKNDAIQALADHFFAHDDNCSFRKASQTLAQRLGLRRTKIGDPHGLCDGDNVSSGKDLVQFCAALIRDGSMAFFEKFDPAGKQHTARPLLDDNRLRQNEIEILLAKTGEGNNRHANDYAQNLMAIAKRRGEWRIALTLSDENRFETVSALLTIDESSAKRVESPAV